MSKLLDPTKLQRILDNDTYSDEEHKLIADLLKKSEESDEFAHFDQDIDQKVFFDMNAWNVSNAVVNNTMMQFSRNGFSHQVRTQASKFWHSIHKRLLAIDKTRGTVSQQELLFILKKLF